MILISQKSVSNLVADSENFRQWQIRQIILISHIVKSHSHDKKNLRLSLFPTGRHTQRITQKIDYFKAEKMGNGQRTPGSGPPVMFGQNFWQTAETTAQTNGRKKDYLSEDKCTNSNYRGATTTKRKFPNLIREIVML